MNTTELVKFRLFQMPCCNTLICWVNPRTPSHCPECGESVYMQLRTGAHTLQACDGILKLKGFNENVNANVPEKTEA